MQMKCKEASSYVVFKLVNLYLLTKFFHMAIKQINCSEILNISKIGKCAYFKGCLLSETF